MMKGLSCERPVTANGNCFITMDKLCMQLFINNNISIETDKSTHHDDDNCDGFITSFYRRIWRPDQPMNLNI